MKKNIFSIIGIIGFTLFASVVVFAQGDDHTAIEEAEGKAIWEKLQARQAVCADLSDEDFGALGEYFMGQMMGSSHSAMNQMMVNMMGEEGEGQAHIVMGKRLSGCDTAAAFPSQGLGFMPMMNMMTGGLSPFGFNQTMILWWILIITGIAILIKWLTGQYRGGASGGSAGLTTGKSALDILKERYAKGEIDKQEFEEKKKGLK